MNGFLAGIAVVAVLFVGAGFAVVYGTDLSQPRCQFGVTSFEQHNATFNATARVGSSSCAPMLWSDVAVHPASNCSLATPYGPVEPGARVSSGQPVKDGEEIDWAAGCDMFVHAGNQNLVATGPWPN